jgi:hypothetical protein
MMKTVCKNILLTVIAIASLAVSAGEELISTATQKNGEVIPYILNSSNAAPAYVFILFPGGSGVVNPRIENGVLMYSAKGNFLVRSRKWMVDNEFATVTTNAGPSQERIQALIDDLNRRYANVKIYLMGTSRGTEDTIALADYLSNKIAGEIHTSSMTRIWSFDAKEYKNRHLIVHHKNDSCRVTPYASALRSHERYGSELMTMEGGISVGDPCEALAYHGYNGIERETVDAIKKWVKSNN